MEQNPAAQILLTAAAEGIELLLADWANGPGWKLRSLDLTITNLETGQPDPRTGFIFTIQRGDAIRTGLADLLLNPQYLGDEMRLAGNPAPVLATLTSQLELAPPTSSDTSPETRSPLRALDTNEQP
jgi:hypothetical protein